jgi:hypothetical protein
MITETTTATCALTFEDRKGYLYVFMSGHRDNIENWKAMAAECRARHATKLLIEEDFDTVLSVTELFVLVEKVLDLFAGIKVAHVDRRASDLPSNEFAATVARNRGAHCQVFRTAQEAEAWLLHSPL